MSRNVGSRFPRRQPAQGLDSQVLDASNDRPWAFVHIDVDQYQSTYDSLAYFYPRMSAGGVIVNDDYGAPS